MGGEISIIDEDFASSIITKHNLEKLTPAFPDVVTLKAINAKPFTSLVALRAGTYLWFL